LNRLREHGEIKNPAELPASRPNSGAGTEKRPTVNEGDITDLANGVKCRIGKK
jgi:hypothetical protein